MKKIILLSVSLTVSVAANAMDVYGISQNDAEKILKKYAKEISTMDTVLQRDGLKYQLGDIDNQSIKKISNIKRRMLEEIKKENGYLFVDIQSIYYPENKTFYSTIEVIDKNKPNRMRFLSAMPIEKKNGSKVVKKPDLIDAMIKYEDISMTMELNHKINSYSCPVYHCTVAFNAPELKPYLTIFNNGVIKEKKLVINTLNNDKDPQRRAAAAFLVGHFSNPREIISVLTSHVDDKDDGVRNNVMRVLGTTIAKTKIQDIDVRPFLSLLDSPYIADRNKALWVLSGAMESASSKKLILQQGGDKLLAILRLKQPNNHNIAYTILKKLSGKDFGSTNVAAWEKWVSMAQQQMV